MAKSYRNIIVSEKPSSVWGAQWRGGYFSGNGKTGANVRGGAAHERVLLNYAPLRCRGRTNVLPDVSLKMKEIKKAADEGDMLALQNVLPAALGAKNFRPRPSEPMPACVLEIDTVIEKGVRDYRRSLDMEHGEVSVSFADGAAKHVRNLFVSWDKDIIVMEMKKGGNKNIEAEFRLCLLDILPPTAVAAGPDGVESVCDKNFLCFAARGDNGLDFGAVVKVSCVGGTVTSNGGRLKVRGASSVLLVASLFCDSQRDREWKKAKTALDEIKDGYDKLKKAHSPLISAKISSSEFFIGQDDDTTAEELMRAAYHGETPPPLIAKLRLYARYLFLSGGGKDLFSAVGLWSGEYGEKGAYDNSALIKVYDWALDSCPPETVLPVFDYFDERTGAFRDNAMRLFGKHGLFVPKYCAPSTGRPGSASPECVYDISLAAKAARLYYRFYKATGDEKFLKNRALPFMKGAAVFYEEFMTADGDGKLHTLFSFAENNGVKKIRTDRPVVGADAVGDLRAIKLLFENLAVCDAEKDKWQSMADRVAAVSPSEGVMRPYAAGRFNNDNAYGLSMFFALGECGESAADIKAYSATLKELLYGERETQDCFSMGEMARYAVILGEKDAVAECVRSVVRGALNENLSAVGKDWRGMGYIADGAAAVDLYGNAALAGALEETVMSVRGNRVSLLPCDLCPDADKEIKNLRRGEFSLWLSYSAKNQTLKATVRRVTEGAAEIVLPAGVKKNVRTNRGVYDQNGRVNVTLRKGEYCEINCKYAPPSR